MRLGIEHLSVFGLPPVQFVELAAGLGCECIGIGLHPMGYNPHGYPEFSLRENKALRRDLLQAMRDHGIAISLGEGCIIRSNSDIRDQAAVMDIFAELGAERLNTVVLDGDPGRGIDQLGIFAEMAAERGLKSTIEPCPVLPIANLAQAADIVRAIAIDGFGLLLDAMHLGRAGTTGAEVAALAPATIGYFQLCDAPLVASDPNYMIEATFERRRPGEGELPLEAYLAALSQDVTVSLEVPLKTQAEAGVGPAERLRPAVAAARRLMDEAADRKMGAKA